MRIVLFCPPTHVINGGIKQIFLLGDALYDAGFDVVVFEEQQRRPMWFPSHVPVVGQGSFVPNMDEVLVLPEDQPQILALFKDWPQRKVLYSQNHFYGSLALQDVSGFAKYGITHAICCSYTTFEHMKWRHPSIQPFLIPCGIDRALFKPAVSKIKRICYMPRKRPVEALFLKDVFQYSYPEHQDWEWQVIEGKTEVQAAQMMGESEVFLSLGRLESLGLTPLEAMASGCVVAGFTGIGGKEFATESNGFWVEEDDFKGAAEQLHKALEFAALDKNSSAHKAYVQAAEKTLAHYTLSLFTKNAIEAFSKITA